MGISTTAIRRAAVAGLAVVSFATQSLATPAQSTSTTPRLSLAELRARYVKPAGRYMRIQGVEVYYVDEGVGAAILMIHGSASTLRTWDGVAARLKDRYRIIRYDIPPQGLSGPVDDAAAARLKPIDIAEGLLDRLALRHVTVVGVSSGGTLGVFLAADRPELVDRLILSNTPADPVVTDNLRPPPAFQAAQDEAKATGFQSMRFWNAYLDFFSGDPARISPRLRDEYYDMNRREPEPNALSLVAQVRDHTRAVEAMSHVEAPTLLIWGGRDPLLPPASADALAHYLTASQVSKIILPDVGHYPPLEVPDRFAQILAAYIEGATPASGAH